MAQRHSKATHTYPRTIAKHRKRVAEVLSPSTSAKHQVRVEAAMAPVQTPVTTPDASDAGIHALAALRARRAALARSTAASGTPNATPNIVEIPTRSAPGPIPIFPRTDIKHVAIDTITFCSPVRKIATAEDLARFADSVPHNEILEFLARLQDGVEGCKLSTALAKLHDTPNNVSTTVHAIRALLGTLDSFLERCPPVDTRSRFGNPSFRDWSAMLASAIDNSISVSSKTTSTDDSSLLAFIPSQARVELGGYLRASFGSPSRVDYGTGHELSFIVFVLSLYKLGLLEEKDHCDIALLVIWRYIETMRKLQFTYWLEPAGSQGVWGLDDYHFVPFLLGAAQLRNHKYLRPKSIHSADVLSEYGSDYMYLSCVQFVNSVKTASLRWHSPMLDDVSSVKSWSKVAEGMLKMYNAEVLGKLPIMQHFLFGGLLPFEASFPLETIAAAADGDDSCHGHSHGTLTNDTVLPGVKREFPSCCGIRVPSAIAAAAATGGSSPGSGLRSTNNGGSALRPVPFD